MKLIIILTILLLGVFTQAKTLSEAVLSEKLAKNENYVFSNTSIDGLLSLISFGLTKPAQDELSAYWNGMSLEDKATRMSSLKESSSGVSVLVNYQVWIDQKYSLLPNYIDDVARHFSVVPEKMDVYKPNEVVDMVNSWAARNTNNVIKEVINEDFVTSDMITILANAVYFKGEWKEKFNETLTVDKEFHGAGLVPTMNSYKSYKYTWNEKEKVAVIELPFKGEKYSMIIAMPAKFPGMDYYNYETDEGPSFSYKSGKNLKKLFKDYIINAKAINELDENGYAGRLDLELPKFTIETQIEDIEEKLNRLGLSKLFRIGALANMTSDPSSKISKILQKAKIIVNEEGAEAAAVSVGGAVVVSAEIPVQMKINGPFVYMIRNNENGERLFEGVVLNPKQ